MADNSYNKTLINIQKLANNSAKTIQELVNKSNKQQMDFNKSEAKTARDWEKMMSDTSHQREVADLKKSGLNPVLSVNNGAQSYTTSSASTSNDSGASATGAILEGQLGAMTNLESARMSTVAQLKASRQQAAATRYAARTSAAAQRAAASAAAAAQKYSADRALERQKYASDKQLEGTKYSADTAAKVKRNVSGSFAGILDKIIRKSGMLGRNITIKSSVMKTFYKHPENFFTNKKGNITENNFKLNKKGISTTNQFLKLNGLRQTAANRRLVVRAYVYGNHKALSRLFHDYKQPGNVWSTRPGYR